MKAFKDGNKVYAASDWRVGDRQVRRGDAADRPAIRPASGARRSTSTSPTRTTTCTGRPARASRPTTRCWRRPSTNYKLASEKLTEESQPKRSLALEYLVAAYGPDKLADPTQAEPVVKRMIELAPNEPTNYFQLAQDLRGLGRVPAGRGDLPQGPRRQAERPGGLPDASPATTTARATSTS